MNLRVFIFIFFIIPSISIAQWVSDIKTESDWEDYLKNGIIDYNTYQLLREMAEGSEIGDTTDFIISTLGISPVEIADNLNYADTRPRQLISAQSRNAASQWSGRLRLGSEIAAGREENFAVASIRSGNIVSELKVRDESGNRLIEKRFIKLDKNNYSLILGNFAADVGCGLSIGRFDYRPVSLEFSDTDLNEFIFPDNSYYNGIKAEYANRCKLIYSAKKYNDLRKHTFGAVVETDIRSVRIGFTGAMTSLSTGSKRSDLGSGSFFINSDRAGLKGEMAYSGSGPGVSLQASGAAWVLRGWYYGDSYINLQSSGYSHPDYQSYTIGHSEISFRQPQVGETGLYAHKQLQFEKFELGNAAEFWKNPRSLRIQYSNSIYIRYSFAPKLFSHIRYTVYKKSNLQYDRFEYGIKIPGNYSIESRVYINFLKKAVATEDSRFYIMVTLPLVRSMSLAGRLRWRFDGLFDYFLEERLLLRDGLFLKATYRWNENLGRDLGALYIFLENRF